MSDGIGIYVTVLLIGVVLTLIVGQVLIAAGQEFLAEVFPDRRTARSVNRLIALLFHLVVLGVIALISTVDFPTDGALETIITKVGVVLLVLGAVYGGTLLVLARIRGKRREQEVADEISSQIEVTRHQQGGAPYGQHVGAPRAHTPQNRPVIEGGQQQ